MENTNLNEKNISKFIKGIFAIFGVGVISVIGNYYLYQYKTEQLIEETKKINSSLVKLNNINLKLNDRIDDIIVANVALKENLKNKYNIDINSKLTEIPKKTPSEDIVISLNNEIVKIPKNEFFITDEMQSILINNKDLIIENNSNAIDLTIQEYNFSDVEAATLTYFIEKVKKENSGLLKSN